MFAYGVVLCCLLAAAAATEVQQCPGKKPMEAISDAIQLLPCKKVPCVLKKGSTEHISIQFTPDADSSTVINRVKADVLGVLLPFVGVDGLSVCDKLLTESGEKASCPVKAGTKYVYKDSFPVLAFYPEISTTVHWALEGDGNMDIACFQVAAKIKS